MPDEQSVLELIKGNSEVLEVEAFKDALIKLFDDVLKQEFSTPEQQGKIARLRARIQIDLRDL